MTHVSASDLKFYATLHQRKARLESGLFLAEGRKLVEEGLKSGCACPAVFVREGFYGQYEDIDALLSQAPTALLPPKEFDKLCGTEHPQGLIGAFSWKGLIAEEPSAPLLPALFSVSDPRNMGTITRSADWFGFSELLLDEGCVDPFNGKAVRSSMGSVFRMRYILKPDLARALTELKGRYRVVVADLDGRDYREFRGCPPSVFVFSNEARGPSDAILALADELATIPGAGRAESLSVAIAASVMMAALS